MRAAGRPPGQTLVLSGRVDVSSVADLRLTLHAAVDAGSGSLHVDVADLELADAAGLGALLGAHRRAQRSGRELLLVNVPERLRRLLFVTRLHLVLRIEPASSAGRPGRTA